MMPVSGADAWKCTEDPLPIGAVVEQLEVAYIHGRPAISAYGRLWLPDGTSLEELGIQEGEMVTARVVEYRRGTVFFEVVRPGEAGDAYPPVQKRAPLTDVLVERVLEDGRPLLLFGKYPVVVESGVRGPAGSRMDVVIDRVMLGFGVARGVAAYAEDGSPVALPPLERAAASDGKVRKGDLVRELRIEGHTDKGEPYGTVRGYRVVVTGAELAIGDVVSARLWRCFKERGLADLVQ